MVAWSSHAHAHVLSVRGCAIAAKRLRAPTLTCNIVRFHNPNDRARPRLSFGALCRDSRRVITVQTPLRHVVPNIKWSRSTELACCDSRQDYDFVKARNEYEDVLQCNNLPSTRTPRGHQFPAAFMIRASGLDKVRQHPGTQALFRTPRTWQESREKSLGTRMGATARFSRLGSREVFVSVELGHCLNIRLARVGGAAVCCGTPLLKCLFQPQCFYCYCFHWCTPSFSKCFRPPPTKKLNSHG